MNGARKLPPYMQIKLKQTLERAREALAYAQHLRFTTGHYVLFTDCFKQELFQKNRRPSHSAVQYYLLGGGGLRGGAVEIAVPYQVKNVTMQGYATRYRTSGSSP